MDAKDIKSNFEALHKLYGLVQNAGDGMSAKTSDMLDEHARLLLKNLLDAATQRVLKAHAEMIAGRINTSWALSPTPLRQTDDLVKDKPSTHGNLAITTAVSDNCRMDDTHRSDLYRKLDGLDITLWTEKIFTPQGSEIGSIEQSMRSVDAGGTESGKKRCRVCQRSTVKVLESTEDSKSYNLVQDTSRFIRFQNQQKVHSRGWKSEDESGPILIDKTDGLNSENEKLTGPLVSNLNGAGYTNFSCDGLVVDSGKTCNSDVEVSNKPEEADCLSREAAKSIDLIELCVSALQIGADRPHLFEKIEAQNQNLVPETKFVPSMTTEEMTLPYLSLRRPSKLVQPNNSYVSDELGKPIEAQKLLPLQKVNEVPGQNVKAIIDKIESGNWRTTRDEFVPRQVPKVQNFSVAPDQNEIFNIIPTLPTPLLPSSKMQNTDPNLTPLKDKGNRRTTYQRYKPSDTPANLVTSKNVQSVDSALIVSSPMGDRGRKRPPNTRENQPELHQKYGNLKNRRYMNAPRRSLTAQESDSAASSSYSSNWRTQQSSSCDIDREEYYSSPDTQRSRYTTKNAYTESGDSLLSDGTQSYYNSFSGNSEDGVYSSTSGDVSREVTSSSSRANEGYSSHDQPTLRRSRSTKGGPSRIRKPVNGINHEKQSGTWKRMKDKLAVIFHHHHHHHHHHHNNSDDEPKKISRNKSLRKQKGKSFLYKREDEAYAEKGVEKMGKSVIHGKNQQNHFNGLMRAFSRHVKQPKKEKVGPLAKGQHGSKKAFKKSNWWQLLQHHRAAKKPNKTHVKIGFGKKKTRLKALPMLK